MGGTMSRRWEMACLLLSGLVIVYTLRVNMSVAAQKMKTELDWSEAQKGYVLSSFYWGYAVGQIPASIIAQYYGAKWLFGLSIVIPSFLTIMVPMACQHSFGAALAIRVLIGFFESANFPAIYHFFPIWVPNVEKTFMIPFIVSGMYMGEIIGFSLSGALANSTFMINGEDWGGWPSIFYVFGIAGMLWFPLWIYAAYESPLVHPYITPEELQFMKAATSFGKISQGAALQDDGDTETIQFNNISLVRRPGNQTVKSQYKKVVDMDTSGGGDGEDNVELSPIHVPSVTQSGSSGRGSSSRLGYMSINTAQAAGGYQSGDTESQGETSSSTLRDLSSPVATPPPQTAGSGLNSYNSYSYSAARTREQDEQAMVRVRIDLAQRTPWRAFVTHPMAIVLLAANFQYGWMNFTLMSEMPSFFTDVLGFDLRSAGVLCIFPYMALFVSAICFGKFFEHLEQERGWHVTNIRRAAQFCAYFCSGVGLILCGYLHNAMAAYACMILTLVFFGSNQSGLGCVWTDIAPNYSSSLNSVGNTVGAIAGILGPIIVAQCTEAWPDHGEGWRVAFFITFLMSCVTLSLWFWVVKAEILPALNNPRSD